MNPDQQFERTARAWLETGPTQAPAHAVDAALRTIDSTPQERDLPIPRRLLDMTTISRLAAVAMIGAIAIGGTALYLSGRLDAEVGASPSPVATPAVPTQPATALPALDAVFTSDCYGYSVAVPMLWPVNSAAESGCPGLGGMDSIEGPTAGLHVGSEPLESWHTGPEWIANRVGRYGQCDGTLKPGSEILIGDVTWTIVKGGCESRVLSDNEGAVDYELVTVAGERRYVFRLHDLVDEALLRAILATVELDPASAVEPSPSPSTP